MYVCYLALCFIPDGKTSVLQTWQQDLVQRSPGDWPTLAGLLVLVGTASWAPGGWFLNVHVFRWGHPVDNDTRDGLDRDGDGVGCSGQADFQGWQAQFNSRSQQWTAKVLAGAIRERDGYTAAWLNQGPVNGRFTAGRQCYKVMIALVLLSSLPSPIPSSWNGIHKYL